MTLSLVFVFWISSGLELTIEDVNEVVNCKNQPLNLWDPAYYCLVNFRSVNLPTSGASELRSQNPRKGRETKAHIAAKTRDNRARSVIQSISVRSLLSLEKGVSE